MVSLFKEPGEQLGDGAQLKEGGHCADSLKIYTVAPGLVFSLLSHTTQTGATSTPAVNYFCLLPSQQDGLYSY